MEGTMLQIAMAHSVDARMATVVEDLFQGLGAGLSTDDVVCMAQVFNLDGWSKAVMTESRRKTMFPTSVF